MAERTKGRVHVMGVAGTAMSAVAGLFKEAGFDVRGSEDSQPYPPVSLLLEDLGIEVMHPYSGTNLDWNPDTVIVGNVIRRVNPEAQALLESGRNYLSFPSALHDFFLKDRFPVVVTGTHGKTSTTSLIAHLLAVQGFDPSFLVGGVPLNFGLNFRSGKGQHFVIEGDEYDTAFFDKGPKFLHYAPQAAIINNIEFDHADIFPDISAVLAAFKAFIAIVPAGAPLLIPANSANCAKVVADAGRTAQTFGIGTGNWHAEDVSWMNGRATFNLHSNALRVGTFTAPMIGRHNLMNTVAALGLLHEIDAVGPLLVEALTGFRGIKKRQEIRGVESDITVIDDFAHHPTAVRETIAAIRLAWPDSKIHVMFEIESNTSRRRVFQDDFALAFASADSVTFCKPLEKNDNLPVSDRIDMDRLCQDINDHGGNASLIPDIDELAVAVAGKARPNDVVVGMSGRDFHGVHEKVLKALKKTRSGAF